MLGTGLHGGFFMEVCGTLCSPLCDSVALIFIGSQGFMVFDTGLHGGFIRES